MSKIPILGVTLLTLSAFGGEPTDLRVGVAGHAFDHLGAIGEQAEAAAASGANILYVSGLGVAGYGGLPASDEIQRQRKATEAYLRQAKKTGIRLAFGYVCATSMVKLGTFDRNWPADFRAHFHSLPAEWRQQARDGSPLPSWYGGDYQAACMNHPDWRTYEKFIVRQQLESGCDGIFFDNPTVHPQGCYCPFCMAKFGAYLRSEAGPQATNAIPGANSIADLRAYAQVHAGDFLRFRCTIARDFLAEMRAYARTLKSKALLTANNSLNSPGVLFSQCRVYGYNIHEMSQAEDFVVVEDMVTQPRRLADGRTLEYGPMYEQLRGISHGKPVVAVALADADYHTPPHLTRLAMAEAAAHGAAYLSWPTWPEAERQRMISLIRPEADFLRHSAKLLYEAQPRRDAVLFLPFRKWEATNECHASRLAAALTRANVQYEVICEDALAENRKESVTWRGAKVLLAESERDFTPRELKIVDAYGKAGGSFITADHTNWLRHVERQIGEASVEIEGWPALRAVVLDQPKRTIVHLYNLDIERRSSFEDKVKPATDVVLTCRIPFQSFHTITAFSADADSTTGPLAFRTKPAGEEALVQAKIPRVEVALIIVIER